MPQPMTEDDMEKARPRDVVEDFESQRPRKVKKNSKHVKNKTMEPWRQK